MDNLEKKFREELVNHKFATSDKVWENISKSLSVKRKIRRFVFWLIVSGILIAAILSGYYYFIKIKHQQKQSNPDLLAANIPNSSTPLKNKGATKDFNSKFSSKKENAGTENKQPFSANFSYQSNLNFPNKAQKSNNTDLEYSSSTYSDVMDYTVSDIINKRKREFAGLQQTPLPHISLSSLSRTKSPIAIGKPQTGTLNDCYPTKRNKWFFELYLSPDYFLKSLSGSKPEYIDSRLETESPLISFSGGFEIGYRFDKNIYIKSGLNYSRINERFHFIKKNVKNTQTVITIDTIWASDGTYTISRDTTINEIYGTEDIQKLISYSMIDIPIILGYDLKYKDIRIGLNAGVILNVVTENKGAMLNMDGEVETFDSKSGTNSIFNKNLGTSIFTSIDASFRLNDKLDIFVEPRFRIYLKPFTTANYPLIQKYTNFGGSFGSRFNFN